jgi:hypothetical protein
MPPRFHRPARLLVAGSVIVAFLGLFAGGQELLGWDDKTNIVDNEGYKGLDGAHLAWMLKAAHLAVYEPFAWLLKAVEHAAFGPSARGFHLVTLALHVASTLVVLDLARRLLGRAWASAEPAEVETGAVFAALLFGIHPLRVEVVAWASGQSYALAGLFFLLSLSAYRATSRPGGAGGWRERWRRTWPRGCARARRRCSRSCSWCSTSGRCAGGSGGGS